MNRSYYLNLKQAFILQLLSIGLYHVYWIYRNWCLLYDQQKIKTKPWILFLGLFIPIFNLYLLYSQFRLIKELADERGVKTYKSPFLILMIYFLILLTTYWLSEFPIPSDLISNIGYLLPIIVIIIVQTAINRFEETQSEQIKFSTTDLIVVLIGLLLFLVQYVL